MKSIGDKIGRLTIVSLEKINKVPFAICICDCGTEDVKVRTYNLKEGNTVSCGCFQKEAKHLRKGKAFTHGETVNSIKTKLYTTWTNIKDRCYNPNGDHYPYYGAKGITVSQDWIDSFDNFKRDMGQPPSNQHSIDRIDYKGNYCKENCRWVTGKMQARNMSTNRIIEIMGYRGCLAEVAEHFGICRKVLRDRVEKGRSDEELIYKGNLKHYKKSSSP